MKPQMHYAQIRFDPRILDCLLDRDGVILDKAAGRIVFASYDGPDKLLGALNAVIVELKAVRDDFQRYIGQEHELNTAVRRLLEARS